MNHSQLRSRRLRFESMESKLLLAADLHAAVVDGDLVVVGSKGDDVLVIESSDEGTWTITPAGDDSINGSEPGQSVTLSGVVDDLRVSLRNGNDSLTIKGDNAKAIVQGSLSVRGSHGTNQVLVDNVFVGNDLSIRTRESADNISVEVTEVGDELVIRSAMGDDSIKCNDVTVGTDLDVHAGGGWYDDDVTVRATTIEGDAAFRASRGDNHVNVESIKVSDRTRVKLGTGDDHVQFGDLEPQHSTAGWPGPVINGTIVFTRQLQIHTDSGEDTIEIADAYVQRHMRSYLGDDNDRMTILRTTVAGNGIIDAGTGDDTVEAGFWTQESAYSSSPWPFGGETSLNGAEGQDTLRYEQDIGQDDQGWSGWEETAVGASLVSNPVPSTPADAVNALAADLYHELAESEENLVFSPLSISAALAMVYAGAESETAAEMAEVLHFPESSEEFHAEFGELLDSLNEADGLEGLDLNVVNSLWKQFNFPFSPQYLELIQQSYDSSMNDVDYVNETEAARQAINQWVEDATEEKIKDLIPQGVLTKETVLVLANAVYFDAKWAHQFEPDRTQSGDFHVTSDEEIVVDMMHNTTYHRYAERDGIQYVELPYEDGRFSMILALPEEGVPVSQVDVTAMTEDLDGFFADLEPRRVAVTLPKFEITSTPDAKQTLIDLGIEDLFDQGFSDLDGMKDPDATLPYNLWVQDVRHKAFIELDEAGTTAAAATAVSIAYTTSMPPEPVFFTADHPFQYFICDTETDTIMFMGHVGRPTESE